MTRTQLLDVLERTVSTAVQAAAAAWLVDTSFTTDGLKVAGVAAVIAAVKCLAAFGVGSANTAALLPAKPDTDLGGQP